MIGKTVQGLDSKNNPSSGVVTSVQVQNGNVALGLDNGRHHGAYQRDLNHPGAGGRDANALATVSVRAI